MASTSFKKLVLKQGEFALDYVESLRDEGAACWFVGRGRVAGNTSPIPSGLHKTPRLAWRAAFVALVTASAYAVIEKKLKTGKAAA